MFPNIPEIKVWQRKRKSKCDRSSLALIGNSYSNKQQEITYTFNLCFATLLFSCAKGLRGSAILGDCVYIQFF
ncbi:hypothetical protein ACS0TY_021628 [Phlomoides rotata]